MSAPVVTLQDKVLWNDLLILVDCVRNNEIEVGVAVDRGPEMIAAHREAAQADAHTEIAALVEALEDAALVLRWAEPEPKPKLARVEAAIARHKAGAQ